MYNYFMLIGRVAKDVVVRTIDDGKKVLNLTIACQRPFKNSEGNYDTDFFNVTLWEVMAEVASDNIRKGAQVGVKGRLTLKKQTIEGGIVIDTCELVGERIVFFSNLSTKVEG